MLYDSNGSNPYIFKYLFVKTCQCATYIYLLLALRQDPLNNSLWAVSEVYGTTEAVLTGHVRPMDRTYPTSQTCPAPGLDIVTPGF
jgi:hypothetical protein